MRLSVRKVLNFVNRDDQQSSRKYLGRICENEQHRTFYGSLIAEFFQFSVKTIKSFVLSI